MEEHDHNKTHAHVKMSEEKLKIAVLFTFVILIVETVGGFLTNSLALLSDAAHVFSDAFALTISWSVLLLASRPASMSRTFGFHRAEVFAALINGVALIVISALILTAAYARLASPQPVKGAGMLAVAAFGLLVNLVVVFMLRGHKHSDLNVRSAFLHAVGDAVSSIGVIVGALIIIFTGYVKADPIISLFIGGIVLLYAARLVRESAHILLEGTPYHINVKEVSKVIASTAGVKGVHDLHVWSICPHINVASAHITVDDVRMSDLDALLEEIKERVARLDISHTTFQFECEGRVCEVEH